MLVSSSEHLSVFYTPTRFSGKGRPWRNVCDVAPPPYFASLNPGHICGRNASKSESPQHPVLRLPSQNEEMEPRRAPFTDETKTGSVMTCSGPDSRGLPGHPVQPVLPRVSPYIRRFGGGYVCCGHCFIKGSRHVPEDSSGSGS